MQRGAIAAIGIVLTASLLGNATIWAQTDIPVPKVVSSDAFTAEYVSLGLRDAEALLYRPAKPNGRGIALVYVHPSGNTFTEPLGREMSVRGYPTVMVNRHGDGADRDDLFGPAISQAVRFAGSLPGISKVVLVGHSGGGHLAAFYQNAAENGPKACSVPEKLYPCDTKAVAGLARPDGLVLLDPTLGTLHQANSIDPATGASGQDTALDMFARANGFDSAAQSASYSSQFKSRFDREQARRSMAITAQALKRLNLLEGGKARFSDDEPLVIEGMGNMASGARLFQPDTSIMARTRGSFATVKADGSTSFGPVVSVRPPIDSGSGARLGTLAHMTRNTTVRTYLATSAIRLGDDFAITPDNIVGVDWRSGLTSTPGNAEGVTVPALVMTMTCHYLVVPGEIIFEHIKSRDKTMVAIDGATHLFKPCRPEYGDTVKRTFDTLDNWLAKEGRFE